MQLSDREQIANEENKEAIAHSQMVGHINAVLATTSGKAFIKYLLESFEVGQLPEIGMKDEILFEYLGFLRAGNTIFGIVAEANPALAGTLLAQITKEKHERR